MKKINKFILTLFMFSIFFISISAKADSNLSGEGNVKVQGKNKTPPYDPEKPDSEITPETPNFTEGNLRFDYISELDFGKSEIKKTGRKYDALAHQYSGAEGYRGFFLQITDQREKSNGWSLQVKQNYQFKNNIVQNADEIELKGAVLSFDNGWANSVSDGQPPIVYRNIVEIANINNNYEVAKATKNSGYGTWLIEFGASETNKNNQDVTIKKDVKDDQRNSAISLTIPDNTTIHPLQYKTELTWTLSELP